MKALSPSRVGWSALVLLCLSLALSSVTPAGEASGAGKDVRFPDLTLLVSPDYPVNWPDIFPYVQINHYLRIGPRGPYNSDIITIDENTGTQFDSPAHGPVPRETAKITPERVPVWQFLGEACVIDVRPLLDDAPIGHSPLIRKQHVLDWEQQHRPLGPGDVVLFRSGYNDKYFKPLPEGRGFVAEVAAGEKTAWPAPEAETMDYVGSRGVLTAGIDSPSMGPLPPPGGMETHGAGLKYGMIWTEGARNLGDLPATGAVYVQLPPKHGGGIGAEVRAFGIVGDPLAPWLIKAARKQRVIDLSVQLSEDLPVWWPGPGAGNSRYPYYQHVLPLPYVPAQHQRAYDSHTGTHLVPPAYALPRAGFDPGDYSPQVREWLAEYEKRYGPRGHSDVTTEKVPLSQTAGWARVIDVKHLIGSTRESDWPASPVIRPDDIREYEKRSGELQPGDVVIFHSGYSDRYLKPFPEDMACMADPLNGKREGWPAPGADAIRYLADRGIRCVATDGPTLGGVDPKRAVMTYWALGSGGMVGVEFLTRVGSMPPKAYFIFAAPRLEGAHGGSGRAIAVY